jgi:endonuclease-3
LCGERAPPILARVKRTTARTQRRKAPRVPRPAPSRTGRGTPKKQAASKARPNPPRRAGPLKQPHPTTTVTPDLRRRALRVVDGLKEAYPDAHCELDFTSALEALVASILAAQSTDAGVNLVTPSLFRKYRTPQDYLDVPDDTLKDEIHSTGFFNQKTKAIKSACRVIVERFGGEVPRTMEELVQLPGVGRKTANVILGNIFKVPGIVVDTHMLRIARRLGFTVEKDAGKVEHDLMAILPDREWISLSHLIPWHGRRCCAARNPNCPGCPVAEDCPRLIE